jgi:hypothetical protein
MTECGDILAAILAGRPLDARAEAHLATCAGCGAEAPVMRAVARAFAADVVPDPDAARAARVLRAAAPLLAQNARRVAWSAQLRALAVALLPLPLIAVLDFYLVRTGYRLLSTILPDALSFYVVLNHAVLLAFLLALTYAAVPILAERQVRLRREELHA